MSYVVIFDMDGVIFDSERLIADLWREVAEEKKMPDIDIAIQRSIGITNDGDAGLLPYFDRIIGGDQVTHSKPDPEIFLKAADALHAKPEECYIIEDSFNGIRAAHAAGMHPVMVPDLLEPDDEIKALYEEIFPSLVEVRKYFENK